jgi:hypothetical protein
VTDLRERHLQVMPTTLIADAFGVTPGDYRRGLLRPTVSLRGAINSLLHGELPASKVAPIPSPGTGFVFSQTSSPIFTDAANGIVAVFKAAVGATTQIYVSRLDLGAPQAGFGPPQQVTATATTSQWGRGAPVPGGDLVVVYITDTTATSRIAYKRAPLNALGAAPEQNVASAPLNAFSLPGIAVTGNIVTFFFFALDGTNTQHFYYRRLRHTDNVWLDPAPAVVPGLTTLTSAQWYTLSTDAAGGVWIAAQQPPPDTMAGRFTPATAAWDNPLLIGALATPTIHATSTGEVWILGKSSSPDLQIHASLFDGTSWIFNNALLAETTAQSLLPGIFETSDGSVWFFWLEATRFIRYRRGYGVVRQLPTDGHPPLFIGGGGGPFSLNISTPQFFLPGPTGSFYAFWSSQAGAGQPAGLWYRQVLAAI